MGAPPLFPNVASSGPDLGLPTAPPQFGGPAPSMAPMVPPSMPQVPQFGGPRPMPRVQPQQQGLVHAAAPIIAAVVAGGRDPFVVGRGLAAYMRGREARRQQLESIEAREQRKAIEQAEFYSRALASAQQIDDPIAFEQWKAAIGPVAQVYGLDANVFTFSDKKRADHDKKLMQDAIDVAVKRHGPEVLNRDDVTLQLSDGRTVSMKVARQATGGGVFEQGAGGAMVPVKVPPVKTPNTDKRGFVAKDITLNGKRMSAIFDPDSGNYYAVGDTTTPLQGEILEYEKPPAPPNPGTADARTNARIDRIVNSFNAHPLVKEFNEVQAQHGIIKQVVNGQWSGPGDMAAVFAFMKALDPTSVVRETEYDNAAKSGNIFAGWAARFNGALNPSGGFLSEQVRRDFLRTIESRLAIKTKQYQNLRTQLVSRVDRIKAGSPETGDEALIDYSSAMDDAPVPPPAATRPRIKKITPVKAR